MVNQQTGQPALPTRRRRWLALLAATLIAAGGCGAAAVPVVPTDIPTATASPTPSPSRTPGRDVTPTEPPTQAPQIPTGGPSPTPLFGPTRVSAAVAATATRPLNPNAPRIEFFTADVLAAAPGSSLTLFWSTRNVAGATIYRLEHDGSRSQLWNVPPDGNLVVSTRRSDRDRVEFVLSAGDGASRTELTLTLPLSCPDAWFFGGGPEACPQGPAIETRLVEQAFERGRMLFVAETNRVYALFNDGLTPAWVVFDNRYDPAAHPEAEDGFQPPPGYTQPLRALGFVWRGNDVVRNRLGLGIAPEASYDGFAQVALVAGSAENLYVSSADGSVLRLVPNGEAWQIITPP